MQFIKISRNNCLLFNSQLLSPPRTLGKLHNTYNSVVSTFIVYQYCLPIFGGDVTTKYFNYNMISGLQLAIVLQYHTWIKVCLRFIQKASWQNCRFSFIQDTLQTMKSEPKCETTALNLTSVTFIYYTVGNKADIF